MKMKTQAQWIFNIDKTNTIIIRSNYKTGTIQTIVIKPGEVAEVPFALAEADFEVQPGKAADALAAFDLVTYKEYQRLHNCKLIQKKSPN